MRWLIVIVIVSGLFGCSSSGHGNARRPRARTTHLPRSVHVPSAYVGLMHAAVLDRDRRALWVRDLDNVREWSRVALPGEAVAVRGFGAGIVVWLESGVVLRSEGETRRLVPLGFRAPVVRLAVGTPGVCGALTAGGIECWVPRPEGEPDELRMVPGSPADIAGLATMGERLCAHDRAGVLTCWTQSSDGGFESPRVIARGVRSIAGGFNLLCFVAGDTRALHCWGQQLEPMGLHDVASLAVGEGIACAIGRREDASRHWLYCWGLASPQASWINVGPHGVDPTTVPRDAPPVVHFARPRPVLPASAHDTVHVLGLVTCVTGANRVPRCDPIATNIPLGATVGAPLPVSRRPYPGHHALAAEEL